MTDTEQLRTIETYTREEDNSITRRVYRILKHMRVLMTLEKNWVMFPPTPPAPPSPNDFVTNESGAV